MKDNAWLGMKLITYPRDATHIVYRFYVDVDTANKSTGKLASWGGMMTTFRTDGVRSVDFAILSARGVVPGT